MKRMEWANCNAWERQMRLLAVMFVLAALAGCSEPTTQQSAPAPPPLQVLDFGVHWPPQDPEDPEGPVGKPFLLGQVQIRQGDSPGGGSPLTATIQLTRPSGEDDREIWNSRLAYREYGWMRKLRVWNDGEQKWLWPNLPYLLRIHGKARFERYGGIDPGSGEDNDFAALLIRAYDVTGQVEQAATKDAPLVSAEWHPVGVADVDRETLVHTARSDEFVLPLVADDGGQQGRLGVWLIYADFMGAPAPQTWPKTLEWNGGILAYFKFDWKMDANGKCELSMEQKTPPSDAGFDWTAWVGPHDRDEEERALAKLGGR